MHKCSISPHTCQYLLFFAFSITAILMGMKCCLTLVLICIPLISDVKHRFIYLSAIYLYVFFGELSIQVLCLIFFFNLTTPSLSCSTWDLLQLWHVGSSSLNRDRTQAPRSALSLSHWTTREVPAFFFYLGYLAFCYWVVTVPYFGGIFIPY